MKIIDVRIECDDDLFDEAWSAAERAADGLGEALYEPDRAEGIHGSTGQRFSVDIFDASEEATP